MTEEKKDLIVAPPVDQPAPLLAFSSIENFESCQRMAKALSTSELVPDMYRGDKGIANCLIAMEVSARTGSSILAVVQNLYVIHGRPSWGSSYIIAALNSCGRFHPLSLPVDGEGDDKGCQASATVIRTGETVDGPRVTIKMAKAEGWYGKKGSKWPTMPDLMLRYRAASFFGRLYAPEILMGMQSDEEARDIAPPTIVNPSGEPPAEEDAKPTKRRSRKNKGEEAKEAEVIEVEKGQEPAQEGAQGKDADQDGPPPQLSDPTSEPHPEEAQTDTPDDKELF